MRPAIENHYEKNKMSTSRSKFANYSTLRIVLFLLVVIDFRSNYATACQFYPVGEYLKFVRVPEDFAVGDQVLMLEVHPRSHLTIMPVDKEEDARYFTHKDVNETHVAVILAQSLEDLVDSETPRNLLKFRFVCDYSAGADTLALPIQQYFNAARTNGHAWTERDKNPTGRYSVSSHLSVTVYVEDVNDHAPEFVGAPYHVTVDEFTPTGLTIFRGIHAFDGDKPNTPNSDVHYAIVKGNEDGKFSLESGHRTALILRKPLDYDTGDRKFSLVVTATDRGTPARTTSTTVTVDVIDNDDLGPKFTQDVYRTMIYESYPISKNPIRKEIYMDTPIHAADQDRDINAAIKYEIITGNDRGLFHIDRENGTLFLEQDIDLDAEKNLPNNTFVLQIHASQIDNPLKFATARVEIVVSDLNDNLPEFEVDFYNISIVENLPNGFSVLQVVARDIDQNENAEFTYDLDDPSGAFSVDPKAGWLTVLDETVLDREKTAFLRMRVIAVEKTPSVISVGKNGSSTVEVEVTLLDANDNNPTFVPSNVYEFVTQSDAKVGSVLGQVHALDSDQGRNGIVKYGIQRTGNSSGRVPFAVDQHSGVIIIAASPIIEGRHAIFIEATDQPVNPSERRFSLAVVTVDVFRSDDSQVYVPDFIGSPYEFWVGANVPIGTSVGQVRLNEAAIKRNNLIYDLLHSYHEGVPFAVEEKSGTITVVDEIERYDRSSYDFEAVVTDERELTLVTNVSIHVVDPNDQRDLFTKGTTRAPLIFHVRENVAGAPIGQVIPQNGTNGMRNIRFLIANQRDVSDISVTDEGALYTLRGLDRETRQNYSITVIAETSRGLGVFQVTIVVDDENDNSPVFDASSYDGRVKENSPSGTEVILTNRISTHDPDEENNAGKYNLTLEGHGSECFGVESATGRVYVDMRNGCASLDREEKSLYDLRLIVNDGVNPRNEVPILIRIADVNDNSPTFTQMIVLPDHGIYVTKGESGPKSRENLSGVDSLRGEGSTQHIGKERDDGSDDTRNDNRSPLVFVPENVTAGTVIIRLLAQDKDEIATEAENTGPGATSSAITYGISTDERSIYANDGTNPPSTKRGTVRSNSDSKPYFVIGSRSGEISVARGLPAGREIHLDVTATDPGNLTDRLSMRIIVEDLNDHPPIFEKSWYAFDVPEGIYDSRKIGKIEAIDADLGRNANVSYALDSKTESNSSILRFEIGKYDGLLTVTGSLDRETRDIYRLCVVASDNGLEPMSSRVDLEINVLDVNDNAPKFHGYSEIGMIKENPENNEVRALGPIYYASLPEDSPVGSVVTKVYANDTDFIGNGNGLILFDLPHAIGDKQYFTIDGKDGLVTIIADLDYETQSLYNLTITARDLGSPSLTSSAMLYVRVLDVEETTTVVPIENDEKPVFQHRYYEIEVEENSVVPVKLLRLNVSERYNSDRIRYGIVSNDIDTQDRFSIDPVDGTLYLVKSVDREIEDQYEIRVKVDRIDKTGRGMSPVMIYPVPNERLGGLAHNEAKIVVRIKDTNDNAPRFRSKGRPLLAAIPTSVPYGYEIIKVEAEDPDEGINGEIRYQILGREDAPRFAIDPLSGQVRSVGSFSRDAGRVFGFDVKATDRRGAENGRSSIANVFVYVLDDHKQVVMVMGKKPTDVETEIEEITKALQNITGLDIRVRKLEPHIEKNLIDAESTDMYLYAVDPNLNVMIDMETLHNVFRKKKSEIKDELERYRMLEIASSTPRRANNRYLLSTLEVGVVVLGCVVFVGALVTALCVTCVRRNKRRHRLRRTGLYGTGGPIGFALTESGSTLRKGPPMFPTFVDGLRYDPEPFANEMTTRRLSHFEHEPSCVRHHHRGTRCCSAVGSGKRAARTGGGTTTAAGGCLEASATSLHSSGQDSGIVARACHCSHSSSPSSGDSSNGYEDSLKSLHRSNELSRGHELLAAGNDQHQLTSITPGSTNTVGRRQRLHSFSNLEGSIYARDASLQRETRYRTNTEKKIRPTTASNTSLGYERSLPEGFNVSRTMIRERANTVTEAPTDGDNPNTLHGSGSSHTLYW